MKQLLIAFLLISSVLASSAQSIVRLAPKDEPGRPFVLDIKVLDIDTRDPVPGAEVYVYQTNHVGDYERDDNDIPRLHGTAYADPDGCLRFYTIYPRGYSNADTGEHMHFEITSASHGSQRSDLIFADYHHGRYDFENPVHDKVYLESLNEHNGTLYGEALIFLRTPGG